MQLEVHWSELYLNEKNEDALRAKAELGMHFGVLYSGDVYVWYLDETKLCFLSCHCLHNKQSVLIG